MLAHRAPETRRRGRVPGAVSRGRADQIYGDAGGAWSSGEGTGWGQALSL